MKRALGRNWGRAAWAFAWLLLGGGALAQCRATTLAGHAQLPAQLSAELPAVDRSGQSSHGRQSSRCRTFIDGAVNVAPSLYGWYRDHLSWHWMFWNSAAIVPGNLACIYSGIPPAPAREE